MKTKFIAMMAALAALFTIALVPAQAEASVKPTGPVRSSVEGVRGLPVTKTGTTVTPFSLLSSNSYNITCPSWISSPYGCREARGTFSATGATGSIDLKISYRYSSTGGSVAPYRIFVGPNNTSRTEYLDYPWIGVGNNGSSGPCYGEGCTLDKYSDNLPVGNFILEHFIGPEYPYGTPQSGEAFYTYQDKNSGPQVGWYMRNSGNTNLSKYAGNLLLGAGSGG